jgi:hypothetical protein
MTYDGNNKLTDTLATLTYIYQYPERQMGDYSRRFGNEDDAKSWANFRHNPGTNL